MNLQEKTEEYLSNYFNDNIACSRILDDLNAAKTETKSIPTLIKEGLCNGYTQLSKHRSNDCLAFMEDYFGRKDLTSQTDLDGEISCFLACAVYLNYESCFTALPNEAQSWLNSGYSPNYNKSLGNITYMAEKDDIGQLQSVITDLCAILDKETGNGYFFEISTPYHAMFSIIEKEKVKAIEPSSRRGILEEDVHWNYAAAEVANYLIEGVGVNLGQQDGYFVVDIEVFSTKSHSKKVKDNIKKLQGSDKYLSPLKKVINTKVINKYRLHDYNDAEDWQSQFNGKKDIKREVLEGYYFIYDYNSFLCGLLEDESPRNPLLRR